MQRPWLGKVETPQTPEVLSYDPKCYLCPGNERASGVRNPQYESTYLFENDFPALIPNIPDISLDHAGLLIARSEPGSCQVLCFSPRHDLTIPRMSQPEVRNVVERWIQVFRGLDKEDSVAHVQIFENHGALMGASNPHPHCQIWANATLPNIPERELHSCIEYFSNKGNCLLCDYLRIELDRNERVVCQNHDFAVVVPYWAVWPYETLLLSKRHFASLDQLSAREIDSLAEIMRHITIRYDNLFKTSCPYSMGFHQRPCDGAPHLESHFHAHYFPPLLRSASVQKFMVGFELLDSPQRDLLPEQAAKSLVDAGDVHYMDGIR
jgi:UDPglucose--hexose-1-phosphate uridylyltransferase